MKPRICEILGVEVREEFFIRNEDYTTVNLHVNDKGEVCDDNFNTVSVYNLYDMINNPSSIIRQPHVTDEEKEILRAAITIMDAKYIARDECGTLYCLEKKPVKDRSTWKEKTAWCFNLTKRNHLFQYVKWSDTEPTLISDLLGK